MSENELEERMARFDEERAAINATPVTGLPAMSLVLYLGSAFSILTAAATGFVDDRETLRVLIIVAVAAMAATVLTVLGNMLAFNGEQKRRDARLADVDERRRKFLREQ